MAQILVRNLDDELIAKLKAQAERSGRSLEAEVRMILRTAVQYDPSRIQEIRAKYGDKLFDDSAGLIREDRES